MIEAPKHLSTTRHEVITEGKVTQDGIEINVLYGVSSDRNPKGTTEKTEVVVTEQAGKCTGYRLVDTPTQRTIDLIGIENADQLEPRERARLMNDSLILASEIVSKTHIPGNDLDMEIKPHRMMRLLLSEGDIVKGLPPLVLHSTGPGNKNEAEAYAKHHGIKSIDRARAALVLLPNSERLVDSHTGK